MGKLPVQKRFDELVCFSISLVLFSLLFSIICLLDSLESLENFISLLFKLKKQLIFLSQMSCLKQNTYEYMGILIHLLNVYRENLQAVFLPFFKCLLTVA